MKKLFLLLLSLSLMLLSCEKSVLNTDFFDEEFRKEHRVMFFESEEEHEHDLRYECIVGRETELGYGSSVYHKVSCFYDNCEFETYIEPHILKRNYSIISAPRYKENGYLYHRIVVYCAYCDSGNWNDISLWVICKNQITTCDGTCLTGTALEDMICDMPYEILSD